MWSLVCLVAHTFIRRLVSGGQQGQDGTKDLEILVLRHQLRVLQRTASPPRQRTVDRVLLAAASRVLPGDRWVAFPRHPGDPAPVASRARILGRRQLDQTLRIYAEHYNRQRPHRAIRLATPLGVARVPVPVSPRDVRRRDMLGGLIHGYHGAAA